MAVFTLGAYFAYTLCVGSSASMACSPKSLPVLLPFPLALLAGAVLSGLAAWSSNASPSAPCASAAGIHSWRW